MHSCTNAYACTHTRFNLFKNYNIMTPKYAAFATEILTCIDQDNDNLKDVIFSNEVTIHTCTRLIGIMYEFGNQSTYSTCCD